MLHYEINDENHKTVYVLLNASQQLRFMVNIIKN
jgi:hypothetical protein